MEGTTTILLALAGLNLVWFSETCVGGCFTKLNLTITCDFEAFSVEGVTSMMHCAYKCHRDEQCLLFQHSEAKKACTGCRVFRDFKMDTFDRPSDIVVYMRALTGSPKDQRDAVCLSSCEADPKPACQEITMTTEVPRNGTCFETCKQRLGFRFYADIKRSHGFNILAGPLKTSCLCGYSDRVGNSYDQCSQVCPKGDDACDEMTVYKYRYGC